MRLFIRLSFLLSCSSAQADFTVCNTTTSRVSVAFAYANEQVWISEGWWNLKPSACESLVRGPLTAQFYYLYALGEHGGEWSGTTFMCTKDQIFRIEGRHDCFARGFERNGFYEIDTGKDTKTWRVQLTEAPSP